MYKRPAARDFELCERSMKDVDWIHARLVLGTSIPLKTHEEPTEIKAKKTLKQNFL